MIEVRPEEVFLFTDASFCMDSKLAGWGVHAIVRNYTYTGGGGFVTSNSGNAEVLAACKGLAALKEQGMLYQGGRVLLYTDSTHTIRVMSRGYSVGDRYVGEAVKDALALIDFVGMTLKMKHVKAHSDKKCRNTRANSLCDRLAKTYMRQEKHLWMI